MSLPKAVLDSSVLVSAFLTEGGTTAALLDRAREGAYTPVIAAEIFAELRRALLARRRLRKKYPYTDGDVLRYFRILDAIATTVTDLPKVSGVVRDPKDDMIIACALKARADCIVTGDEDLLALGTYRNIRILTPRQFLDELARG